MQPAVKMKQKRKRAIWQVRRAATFGTFFVRWCAASVIGIVLGFMISGLLIAGMALGIRLLSDVVALHAVRAWLLDFGRHAVQAVLITIPGMMLGFCQSMSDSRIPRRWWIVASGFTLLTLGSAGELSYAMWGWLHDGQAKNTVFSLWFVWSVTLAGLGILWGLGFGLPQWFVLHYYFYGAYHWLIGCVVSATCGIVLIFTFPLYARYESNLWCAAALIMPVLLAFFPAWGFYRVIQRPRSA